MPLWLVYQVCGFPASTASFFFLIFKPYITYSNTVYMLKAVCSLQLGDGGVQVKGLSLRRFKLNNFSKWISVTNVLFLLY